MTNQKLMSSIEGYEYLLEALKSGDCHGFIYTWSTNGGSPDDLDAVDAGGKSLREYIQESGIDFSKKHHKDMFLDKVYITPLQAVFVGVPDTELEIMIKQLRLVLALNVDVNTSIDENQNTFLHRYLKYREAHPEILKMLFLAGGDFLKKNIEGKTPIDLAKTASVREYLKKLVLSPQDAAAIKIQRGWRKHSHKTKPQTSSSVVLKHILLDYPAVSPQSHPPDKDKMNIWVEMHEDKDKETAKKVIESVQHISHKRFLMGLKIATQRFNTYLSSLPKSDQHYVIVIDTRVDKSYNWVTKLSEKYLTVQPDSVITTDEIASFKPNEKTKHLVVFDDAAYSGNSLINYLEQYCQDLFKNNKLFGLEVHLIVPFVSEAARRRFENFKIKINIHSWETLFNFNVPGTLFTATTATYFDHKIPDSTYSTISSINDGKLISGKEGIRFVDEIKPPYKLNK